MTDRISSGIDNVEALERVVGKMPGTIHLKVIDHLDAGALHWIAAAPLMFAGVGDAWSIDVMLGGGPIGFARADAHRLCLPTALLDRPAAIRAGMAFGSLFLIPGLGETLRVNGRVTSVDADEIVVAVHECYGHCAKALIRSEWWEAAPMVDAPVDRAPFVAASRFIALATIDAEGRADVSPKGDPAGRMARLEGDTFWFADRPGNRRVDSFRNILAHPHVAAAVLIPGSDRVMLLRGIAQLTTDETARSHFVVQDRTPLLAVRVETSHLDLHTSAALARARLWPVTTKTHGIEPARLFMEHIKRNRERGFAAKLASAALAVPGAKALFRKGLEKDYRDNLY